MSQLSVTFVSLAVVATVLTSFAPSPHADAPAGRYTPAGDVVTDNVTKLIWLKKELNGTYTWEAAKAECAKMDARLPNVLELAGLVDVKVVTPPPLDSKLFEGRTSGSTPTKIELWTSTSYAVDLNYAWRVSFATGHVFNGIKTASNGVRCVRPK